MNSPLEHIKRYRHLAVALAALLGVSILATTCSRQKKRPAEAGSEYLDLAVSIKNLIKSVDEKVSDEYSFGTRPFEFSQSGSGPSTIAPPAPPSLEKIFAPAQVRGIAFKQDRPLVFIGSRVLKEGDWIGGFKIEEISRESFIVTDHSGQETRIMLNPLAGNH